VGYTHCAVHGTVPGADYGTVHVAIGTVLQSATGRVPITATVTLSFSGAVIKEIGGNCNTVGRRHNKNRRQHMSAKDACTSTTVSYRHCSH
jgi:hypothetical protein